MSGNFVKIIQETIEAIKAKEAIVFCGAGISKHSGLPMAENLVTSVLETLNASKEEIETIIKAGLPFELFMDTLLAKNNSMKLLDIFKDGKPNTNHILLAKLVKAGILETICTTNFD